MSRARGSWPNGVGVATISALVLAMALRWGSLGRHAVRWLSLHTGLPALVVAAVLIVVGYRILKKSARFAVEVALIAALLFAATCAGWIRW